MKELFQYLEKYGVKPSGTVAILYGLNIENNKILHSKVDLSFKDIKEFPDFYLPDGLYIKYSLDLYKTIGLFSLPRNLKIGIGLDLVNSSIKELPENLSVAQTLDIRNTSIYKLPDDLNAKYILVNTDDLKYFKRTYPKWSTKFYNRMFPQMNF
jgi:hypothetical protein